MQHRRQVLADLAACRVYADLIERGATILHTSDEPVRIQIEVVKKYLRQHFQHVQDPAEIQKKAFDGFHTISIDIDGSRVFVELNYVWLQETPASQISTELEQLKVVEHLRRPNMSKVRIRPNSVQLIPR